MKLTKKQRSELRMKFDGKCAYCGCVLPERWHADHFEPVKRGVSSYVTGRDALHPERHCIENMMPACAPCNISKGSMSLDSWRSWLAGHVASLNSYHPIYRISKAFGLVEETGKPVIFYFERIQQEVA